MRNTSDKEEGIDNEIDRTNPSKIGGPMQIGALYVDPRTTWDARSNAGGTRDRDPSRQPLRHKDRSSTPPEFRDKLLEISRSVVAGE